jgi:hypothetical protein
MWGLVYVGVCVAFKAIVKTFPILGGLFQVYRWALRILQGIDICLQKIIIIVRSCVHLCS